MNRGLRRGVVLALIVIAGAAGVMKALARPVPGPFLLPAPSPSAAQEPARFDASFVSVRAGVHAHAASLVELGDGRVRVFWWEGSREGAQDVDVRTAVLDPSTGRWRDEQVVATREAVQRDVNRYVRKLGNAVAGRTADGSLRLFVVTVSVGGWAGSSITTMTSRDEGATWSPARRLITSPFLNFSTLVRSAPFLHADATQTVPVYHEFLGKFGELLRLDAAGRVFDKQRLTAGDLALQPLVLVRSPTDALALLRNGSSERPRRVIQASTADAGAHWSAPARAPLPNPDAPLSGVALPDGTLAVALNDQEAGRSALSLVLSNDGGKTWRRVYRFEDQSQVVGAHPDPARFSETVASLAARAEDGVADRSAFVSSSVSQMCKDAVCDFEFSYPFLIRARDGEFHLVYTWNRSFIRTVRFNEAWLAEHARKAGE